LAAACITKAGACRFCLLQPVACVAFSFAGLNAGSQNAARMAMQAMTTSRSIQVNPVPFRPFAMVFIFSVIASYSVLEPPAGAIHKLRPALVCNPTAALRDRILGFPIHAKIPLVFASIIFKKLSPHLICVFD
jgi:hypothetical protein